MHELVSMRMLDHQLESTRKMSEKEQGFMQAATSVASASNTSKLSNWGILGNDPATGKTRTIIAHLLRSPQLHIDYVYQLDKLEYFPLVLSKLIDEYLTETLESFYCSSTKTNRYDAELFHNHEYPAIDLVNGVIPDPAVLKAAKVNDASELDSSKCYFGEKQQHQIVKGITVLPCNLLVVPHFTLDDTWKTEFERSVIPAKLPPPKLAVNPKSNSKYLSKSKSRKLEQSTSSSSLSSLSSSSTTVVASITATTRPLTRSATLAQKETKIAEIVDDDDSDFMEEEKKGDNDDDEENCEVGGKGKKVEFETPRTYYLNFVRQLKELTREKMKNYDIVLCSSKRYVQLAKYCDVNRLKWQRVIFDEVDTINIPSCPSVDAFFYWGITGTWTGVLKIGNRGFLHSMFAKLKSYQMDKLLVRIPSAKVDKKCYDFLPYIRRQILCKANVDHRIISECFPNTTLIQLMNEELFVKARLHMLNLVRGVKGKIRGKFSGKKISIFDDDDDDDNHNSSEFNSTSDRKKVKDNADSNSNSNNDDEWSQSGILELSLANIALHRGIQELTRMRRLHHLLSHIFAQNICVRCTRDIAIATIATTDDSDDDDDKDEGEGEGKEERKSKKKKQTNTTTKKIEAAAASVHLSCCHLNYCTYCAVDVTICPACLALQTGELKDLKRNNTVNDVSAVQFLNNHLKRIDKLEESFYSDNNSDLDSDAKAQIKARIKAQIQREEYELSRPPLQKSRRGKRKYDILNSDVTSSTGSDDTSDSSSGNSNSSSSSSTKIDTIPSLFPFSSQMVMKVNKGKLERELMFLAKVETNISKFVDEKCDFIVPGKLDKVAALLEILQRHIALKHRILVFINNATMSKILTSRCYEKGIDALALHGAPGRITNVLKLFNAKSVGVLIVNGNSKGRGLNVTMADVQVIYDAKNQQTVTQAIARTQRFGRSADAKPLIVYGLKHQQIVLNKSTQ